MSATIRLKTLLRQRHWQTYPTFCREYDKAARSIDVSLVGSYPSRGQLHRWTSGELKGLPYPHHCELLEAMFPGESAAALVAPDTTPVATVEPVAAPVSPIIPAHPKPVVCRCAARASIAANTAVYARVLGPVGAVA